MSRDSVDARGRGASPRASSITFAFLVALLIILIAPAARAQLIAQMARCVPPLDVPSGQVAGDSVTQGYGNELLGRTLIVNFAYAKPPAAATVDDAMAATQPGIGSSVAS